MEHQLFHLNPSWGMLIDVGSEVSCRGTSSSLPSYLCRPESGRSCLLIFSTCCTTDCDLLGSLPVSPPILHLQGFFMPNGAVQGHWLPYHRYELMLRRSVCRRPWPYEVKRSPRAAPGCCKGCPGYTSCGGTVDSKHGVTRARTTLSGLLETLIVSWRSNTSRRS